MVEPLHLPPDSRGPPYHWVVFLILAMLGLIGILVVTKPPPETIIQPAPRMEVVSPEATFPAELIAAAVAEMTFFAPTVTPIPTPTETPLPGDVAPHVICADGVGIAEGDTCTMPTNQPPPPTALPDCPTVPNYDCVWRGTLAGSTPVDYVPAQMNPPQRPSGPSPTGNAR